MTDFSITPEELHARYDAGETPALLDVREPHELALARLPHTGAHIPLGELEGRLEELAPWKSQELIVFCHHGIRSAHATRFLRQNGFSHARNLSGGIDQWSVAVDPSLPRY